jgi:hypothetical protein
MNTNHKCRFKNPLKKNLEAVSLHYKFSWIPWLQNKYRIIKLVSSHEHIRGKVYMVKSIDKVDSGEILLCLSFYKLTMKLILLGN